jgi:hypothetical protein
MKRRLVLLAPLMLAACSSGATLNVSLTSDDAGENALVSASGSVDLTTVKSVNLTVSEMWAHVEDSAPDSLKGDEVDDDDKQWVRLSAEEKTLDLITVRSQTSAFFDSLEIPQGKLTQLRLKLKPGNADPSGRARYPGAVVQADGTACDLLVPTSAISPGVKISGAFKAMNIEADGKHLAVLNIKLKDSEKLNGSPCTYRLNPELKVKKFELDKH